MLATLATLALTALLALLDASRGFDLQLDLESPAQGANIAMRYDDGHGFGDEAAVAQPLRAGLHRYVFRVPVAHVVGLRIDPGIREGTLRIGAIEATHAGRVLRRWRGADLQPGGGIADWHPEASGAVRFTVHAQTQGAYVAIPESALQAPTLDTSDLAALALVAACVVAAIGFVRALGPPLPAPRSSVVLAAVGVAIGLVLAIASLAATARPVNPDEVSHVSAALYYADHWLPPAVGDPASLPSYSQYGASYLNELDIVYLVAAKFSAALSFTGLDDVLRLRLFNVALLVLCAACALRSRLACLAMLPMLCSAQVWYVFGYFNADAIALTAAFLLTIALATWLERAAPAGGELDWRWAIAIGVLIALCLLSKRTLYPYLPFVVGYAALRSGFRAASGYLLAALGLALLGLWFYMGPPHPGVRALMPSADARRALALVALLFIGWGAWHAIRRRPANVVLPRTLLGAIGIGVAIFALRVAVEIGINGGPGHKALALNELAERIAAPIYRPSMVLSSNGYFGMVLAAKGLGLGRLLFGEYLWPSTVANSFFGLYGYLSIWAPQWMYRAQYWAAAILVAAIALPLARRSSSRPVLAIGIVAALLTIELAVLNSWVIDFQPQGRYVFAIVPIVGVLLLQRDLDGNADLLDRTAGRVARLSIAALWLLAVLSSALVALPGLAHQ